VRNEIDIDDYGTHMRRHKPRGGWPNTCEPVRSHTNHNGAEVLPKKVRRRNDRKAARLKAFEDIRVGGQGDRRPGSKWIACGSGKYQMYHQPGSNKK
jgi:hypothetical protein